jgi:hypothetical protein
MSQEVNKFLDFVASIDVMKPGSIDKDNMNHLIKLDKLLDDPLYVAEEKIDGCRYKMFGCRFFSSDNVEKTDNFPHLREFFVQLGMPNLILDGEINYPGKTSQYCTRVTGSLAETAVKFQEQNGYIHYKIYDILRTPKATWMVHNTYQQRRKLLQYFYDMYIKGTPMEQFIQISDREIDNKRPYLEKILDDGGEGIVLKHVNSLYVMGKNPMWQWMKWKKDDEADLIIIGLEDPTIEYKGKNIEQWPFWRNINGIDTPVTKNYYNGWCNKLIMGAYVDGEIQKICTAAGLTEEVKADIKEHPKKYLNRVARITFMEKTEAGYPRHPNFHSLHEDKQPDACIWTFTNKTE